MHDRNCRPAADVGARGVLCRRAGGGLGPVSTAWPCRAFSVHLCFVQQRADAKHHVNAVLQHCMRAASLLMMAGSVIRTLPSIVGSEWRHSHEVGRRLESVSLSLSCTRALFPFYFVTHCAQEASLAFVHVGQVLNAAAGPLVNSAPSLLAHVRQRNAIWLSGCVPLSHV